MNSKRPIALISAVPLEGSHFVRVLNPTGTADKSCPLSAYAGKLFGCSLLYMTSGMGKVNAAHAATLIISQHRPALIVNFGIGGAYPSAGLAIGDVAVATKEIYADEGIWTAEGLQTLDATGIPLLRLGHRSFFNEFPLNSRRTGKLPGKKLIACWGKNIGINIKTGPFATVSACTGTQQRAEEIERRFGVICENMEGAAVAHICALYGTPLIEIRGISNIVEERNRASWNIDTAAEHSQLVVLELLKALSEKSPVRAV